VAVEGLGRTGIPDCPERSVDTSELLQQADGGLLARRQLDMIDELLNLRPAISDPKEVAAGNPNRPGDAGLRAPEPLPQAPQSRCPPAADPGPVNPQDKRRLSVYPHVEVELTADVCPAGPSRNAGDQGRDGRIICAWPWGRTSRARQGKRPKPRFRSWQWPSSAPDEGSAGEPILLNAGRSCHAFSVVGTGRTSPDAALAATRSAQCPRTGTRPRAQIGR
jgi:hypothetical protein